MKVFFFELVETNAITIPSAAAVASSKSEAFATSIAVIDMTMVWKLTKDSRRPKIRMISGIKIARSTSFGPCAISGW